MRWEKRRGKQGEKWSGMWRGKRRSRVLGVEPVNRMWEQVLKNRRSNRSQKRTDSRVREGNNQVLDKPDHTVRSDKTVKWVVEVDEDTEERGRKQGWCID